MTLWIVGASGMLGRELQLAANNAGIDSWATDRELNVTDEAAVREAAFARRPSHIINAAAYTRVDDAEQERDAAMLLNGSAPGLLARVARELGAQFVHYSTDYVFDGRGDAPLGEQSTVNPQSVYGLTKLEGERQVLATVDEQHPDARLVLVLRTSWLFGQFGRNFVSTMLELCRTRDELRVVADQHGCPTAAADLAEVTLRLLGLTGAPLASRAHSGVYHATNQGPTTWHGFASAIREQALSLGGELRARAVLPVTTAEFPRPAPRPAFSVLDGTRLSQVLGAPMRPWTAALNDYLRAVGASAPHPLAPSTT